MWGRCCGETTNQRRPLRHQDDYVENIVEQYSLTSTSDESGMTLWSRCCGDTRTTNLKDGAIQRPVVGMGLLPLHEVTLSETCREENVAPLYDVTPPEHLPVLAVKGYQDSTSNTSHGAQDTCKGGIIVHASDDTDAVISPASSGLFAGCNGCSAVWHIRSDEDQPPAYPVPRSAAVRLDQTALSWRQPRPEAEKVFKIADELKTKSAAKNEVAPETSVLCSVCSCPTSWLCKPKHYMCCNCRQRCQGYRWRCESCDFDLCTDCCSVSANEEIPSEGTRVRTSMREKHPGSKPEEPAAVKAAAANAANKTLAANKSPKSRSAPQPNSTHAPPPQKSHDPAEDDDLDTLREVKNAAKMAAPTVETPTKEGRTSPAPTSPMDSDFEDLLNMTPEDRAATVTLRGEALAARLEDVAAWCNTPLPRPGTKTTRKDRVRMAWEDAQRAKAEKAAQSQGGAFEFKPPPRGNAAQPGEPGSGGKQEAPQSPIQDRADDADDEEPEPTTSQQRPSDAAKHAAIRAANARKT